MTIAKIILSALITTVFLFQHVAGDPEQVPLRLSANDRRPNIVFIMTDDQDVRMGSLDFMPHVQKHLIKEGTFFARHYATIALCCPSRVSLWTGRAAHNTNVTSVNPPYGKQDRIC